jgi:hypothetical protein
LIQDRKKSADRNLSVQLVTNVQQDEITDDCELPLGTLDMRILLPELIRIFRIEDRNSDMHTQG